MKRSKYIFLVCFSLLIQTFILAQCDKVGQVVQANQADCALLIQLENGDLIEPINSETYSLNLGEMIQFDFEQTGGNLTCSGSMPIQLTCVTEPMIEPDCTADFLWFLSPNANPIIAFQAVTQATDTYELTWGFGDGTSSTETMPSHQYTASGEYEVCLTVTYGGDCTVTHCENIVYTTSENIENCNFGLELEVVGLTVNGTIFNYVDFGPYQPQEVSWFNHTTGELLSESADFTYTFSNTEAAEIITAMYTVTYEDGTTCEGAICEPVVLENTCEAAFDYEILENHQVQFTNISLGNMLEVVWTINGATGAGTDWVHDYDVSDYYEICLNIRNEADCEAEYCETIFLGTTADLCDIEDCVYPGDANQDGASNYLDVLNMGLGYGLTGPSRTGDFIDSKWAAIPAENWGISTLEGIDYKHLDANGDGTIDEADITVIAQHYMPADTTDSPTVEGHPHIWLDFLEDNITIDEDSPEQIEILAKVMLGESTAPITDLYGLAFQLSYPGELVVPYSIEMFYQEETFLGAPEDILAFHQDLGTSGWGLFDAVYSRKNQQSSTGYGDIAIVKFIIESDIIGGRAEPEIDFSIGISKLKMIDHQGLEKEVNLPAQPVTIKILNTLQNSTSNPNKEERVTIYPNPVQDVLTIKLEYLEGERLLLYNAMGQLVQTQPLTDEITAFSVKDLSSGMYWMKIYTDKGAVSKRVFVE